MYAHAAPYVEDVAAKLKVEVDVNARGKLDFAITARDIVRLGFTLKFTSLKSTAVEP